MDRYGRAVVEERLKPQHLAEVARYLRMEYGPGTEPGHLLASLADGSRPRSRGAPRLLRRMAGALAGALRALMPNASRAEQRRAEPTR